MTRRRIKEATLKKLFVLSGNRCAFPDCEHPVVNEHDDLIAEICHIEAAKAGGQRYNAAQTDEQRRSFENLIILCPTHHATTDNVAEYPVARLQQMKRDHEDRFRHQPLELSEAKWQKLLAKLTGIALSRLPRGASKLIGRDKELRRLTTAHNSDKTHVVEIVAWGGVGKTALTVDWMTRLAARDWPGIERYFDWSFYSQGSRDQSAVSADLFIAQALAFFGDPDPQAGSPHDRGDRLARLIAGDSYDGPPTLSADLGDGLGGPSYAKGRTILILDGVEPLQYGAGPLKGQIKDPALRALLKGLAQRPFSGLCVVNTREELTDLKQYHHKTVSAWKLDHLSPQAGAKLLHSSGATRSGQAPIKPDDAELLAASGEVDGHALTLGLLGGYLKLAHHGDIRRRDRVRFEKADRQTQGGHAFRVMAAYERWLAGDGEMERRSEGQTGGVGDGENAQRMLAVLRLLGLFDRPASADCQKALRQEPAIKGLTERLVNLDGDDWNIAITLLQDLGLVSFDSSSPHRPLAQSPPLDSHPLLREYFAAQLRAPQDPDICPKRSSEVAGW